MAPTVPEQASADPLGVDPDLAAVAPPAAARGLVLPDDAVWELAAAELTPARSLARIDEWAKQTVLAVGLLGMLVIGFGTVVAGGPGRSPVARWLASAAVVVAVAAVLVALAAMLGRFPGRLAPECLASGDLVDVKAWYRRQVRRAYGVAAAGVLVAAAVAVAGVASLVALTGHGGGRPSVSVQLVGAEDPVLSVRLRFPQATAEQVLTTEVVGMPTRGTPVVLARGLSRVDDDQTAAVDLEVPQVGRFASIQLRAVLGHRSCTAVLPQNGTKAASRLVCTGR